VPEHGLIERVRKELLSISAVASIHHEHAWSLDGESTVYTAHLEMGSPMASEEQIDIKSQIADRLQEFEFSHTTIELEFPQEDCRDDS
jgi:cobalt-zinc-cadmium efflux system protein